MLGMLLGGIAFGILGDRLGRLTVLFGSILLYSVANIANGFVHSVEAYGVCRFIAGFGLAGELGAASRSSPKCSQRNAGLRHDACCDGRRFWRGDRRACCRPVKWPTAYFIGGGLGLILLVLRVSVAESGMFKQIKKSPTSLARKFPLPVHKPETIPEICPLHFDRPAKLVRDRHPYHHLAGNRKSP